MRSSALTSKHHHLYRAGGRGPDVLVAILAQALGNFPPTHPPRKIHPVPTRGICLLPRPLRVLRWSCPAGAGYSKPVAIAHCAGILRFFGAWGTSVLEHVNSHACWPFERPGRCTPWCCRVSEDSRVLRGLGYSRSPALGYLVQCARSGLAVAASTAGILASYLRWRCSGECYYNFVSHPVVLCHSFAVTRYGETAVRDCVHCFLALTLWS